MTIVDWGLRIGVATVLALAFAMAPAAAHEGHDHLILGTVDAVERGRVQVTGLDREKKQEGTFWIRITDQTRFRKDGAAATADDLEVGLRVVVNVGSGERPLTAKEIRLAS